MVEYQPAIHTNAGGYERNVRNPLSTQRSAVCSHLLGWRDKL